MKRFNIITDHSQKEWWTRVLSHLEGREINCIAEFFTPKEFVHDGDYCFLDLRSKNLNPEVLTNKIMPILKEHPEKEVFYFYNRASLDIFNNTLQFLSEKVSDVRGIDIDHEASGLDWLVDSLSGVHKQSIIEALDKVKSLASRYEQKVDFIQKIYQDQSNKKSFEVRPYIFGHKFFAGRNSLSEFVRYQKSQQGLFMYLVSSAGPLLSMQFLSFIQKHEKSDFWKSFDEANEEFRGKDVKVLGAFFHRFNLSLTIKGSESFGVHRSGFGNLIVNKEGSRTYGLHRGDKVCFLSPGYSMCHDLRNNLSPLSMKAVDWKKPVNQLIDEFFIKLADDKADSFYDYDSIVSIIEVKKNALSSV